MMKYLKNKYVLAVAGFAIGGLFGGGLMASIKGKVVPTKQLETGV